LGLGEGAGHRVGLKPDLQQVVDASRQAEA
jgi:hypothetical protein